MVVEICSVTAFTVLGDTGFFDGEKCETTASWKNILANLPYLLLHVQLTKLMASHTACFCQTFPTNRLRAKGADIK